MELDGRSQLQALGIPYSRAEPRREPWTRQALVLRKVPKRCGGAKQQMLRSLVKLVVVIVAVVVLRRRAGESCPA